MEVDSIHMSVGVRFGLALHNGVSGQILTMVNLTCSQRMQCHVLNNLSASYLLSNTFSEKHEHK